MSFINVNHSSQSPQLANSRNSFVQSSSPRLVSSSGSRSSSRGSDNRSNFIANPSSSKVTNMLFNQNQKPYLTFKKCHQRILKKDGKDMMKELNSFEMNYDKEMSPSFDLTSSNTSSVNDGFSFDSFAFPQQSSIPPNQQSLSFL